MVEAHRVPGGTFYGEAVEGCSSTPTKGSPSQVNGTLLLHTLASAAVASSSAWLNGSIMGPERPLHLCCGCIPQPLRSSLLALCLRCPRASVVHSSKLSPLGPTNQVRLRETTARTRFSAPIFYVNYICYCDGSISD